MSSLSGGKSTRPARVGATAKRGPFALYAPDYFDAGWFPFPCVVDPKTRTKVPAPGMKGWAPGRDNPYPDRARVEEWAKRYRGAHIMLGGASDKWPEKLGSIHLYVPDSDATYRAAIEAGGRSLYAPTTHFYGDRSAGVEDPSGLTWWISTHVEDVSPEEMERRMASQQPG